MSNKQSLRNLETEPRKLWKKIRHKYEDELKRKYEKYWLPKAKKIHKRNMEKYNESPIYQNEYGHEFPKYKPEPPMSFEKWFTIPVCERCKEGLHTAYYYSNGLFICYHCYIAKVPRDMLNWLINHLSGENQRKFHKYKMEGKWG